MPSLNTSGFPKTKEISNPIWHSNIAKWCSRFSKKQVLKSFTWGIFTGSQDGVPRYKLRIFYRPEVFKILRIWPSGEKIFLLYICLASGGGSPPYPEIFPVLHDDPAAPPQDHCGRCRIRNRKSGALPTLNEPPHLRFFRFSAHRVLGF